MTNYSSRSKVTVVYYGLIVASIVLFAMSLWEGFPPLSGKDAEIFCMAGDAIQNGRNPYIVSELGGSFSWNYLPIFAYGFGFLCRNFLFEKTFPIFYIVAVLAGIVPWISRKDWGYAIPIVGTGLYSLGWTLRTGNVGAIEFIAISISSFLLMRKKYNAAFFLLGLGASIKLFPLLYFPAYLFLVPNFKTRIKALIWGGTGFLMPFIVSLAVSPQLFPWYLKQLLGLIPNQHSPVFEGFGFYNPSFFTLLTRIFSITLDTRITINISMLLYGMGVIALLIYKARNNLLEQNENRLKLFFYISMIAITLLMPRIKGYSFMPALLFIYLITDEFDYWARSIIVAMLSILPMVAGINYLNTIQTSGTASASFILAIQEFNQPFFLITTLIFILYVLARQSQFANGLSRSPISG